MARKTDNLFQRLTSLFRSGPVIKRRVKAYKQNDVSTAHEVFKKTLSHVYSSAMSAYGTYDRMARYSDYSEMEYCVTADTLIAVPSGFKTIGELTEEYGSDRDFIVYSYDHNRGEIVPAIAKHARQTRVDHAFTVTFDSGKTITGTANHRLMLRDGSYRRIDELTSGDSMMPFYRRDLYAYDNKPTGYQWIYTMSPEGHNGWKTEHKLIAEWALGRPMDEDEVVHHCNFVKSDNRPENLEIMTRSDHSRLHQVLLNEKKWDDSTNGEWIEAFKNKHSIWMQENNPAERKDITFGRILEICEREGFNSAKLCKVLDTDVNVIKRRLRKNGFDNFVTFAQAYDPDWQNSGWDNSGTKNPRYDSSLSFQMVCDAFEPGISSALLAQKLDTTQAKLVNRVKSGGYRSYGDFKQNYRNHTVVSVEYHGVVPLYDLTVDGYKNFATDSVVSHNTPEIASALDIYAEETSSADDKGRALHVYSENRQIKQILHDLFYDTLNVEFNLTPWVRDLVKYGDLFLFNDVSTQYGVQNVFPIAVNEIEREEGFDPQDPLAVRFRWVTQGNQVLENWQVTHMRLMGNDAFMPYGSSVLESARRIWRQLILIEDAMLVYRVVRSPERRVFYIDVGNVPPEDVPNYMEQARGILRSNQVIDQSSGRVDLRYNPLSVDEDYFIPIRGLETGTKIETLAGGTNVTAIEDVEYIQKKLFSALKVPKAYLGYDEALGSKATLSQEDIRFSRTIARIQRTILSELNKLAIIHLFCHGYEGEDLLDFELKLSNPSTIAQQQKLELHRMRFDIAAAAPEGIVDKYWIRKNIMGLTDDEIDRIERGRMEDKQIDMELEQISVPDGDEG
ncbi:portal protein, partial [Candidatus Bathyarchaeota archaeon]|nr:portal protein [Candidatus Bathyarchaeota archaeon]